MSEIAILEVRRGRALPYVRTRRGALGRWLGVGGRGCFVRRTGEDFLCVWGRVQARPGASGRCQAIINLCNVLVDG